MKISFFQTRSLPESTQDGDGALEHNKQHVSVTRDGLSCTEKMKSAFDCKCYKMNLVCVYCDKAYAKRLRCGCLKHSYDTRLDYGNCPDRRCKGYVPLS